MDTIMRASLIFPAGLLALACSAVWAADPIPVVTGNTIVHDLALRIGGDRISASCLLQPGVDPHEYQPVPEDVKKLAGAKLVIINGLGFEGWFEGLAKEARFSGILVVATAGVVPLRMRGGDHADQRTPGGGEADGLVDDPHAYHSLALGVRYAENIRDALSAADPSASESYRTRAMAVIDELRATDAWAKRQFAAIPKAQRKIVTNHDALQYFAAEYGFEILAPNTALEDSQPSAKDIAALVDVIRAEGVTGIFLEFGKHQRVIEQLASEAGVRVGAELYLDGVGPPGGPAATYLGMFRSNVEAIVTALR
jgi:zinc/manganese transport system substrate-binding protein